LFSFAEKDGGMEYRITLANNGAAQSYKDYGMVLTLVNGESKVVLEAKDFESSSILSGDTGSAEFSGDMPESGEWTAYIRMTDDDGREIKLAMDPERYNSDIGYNVGTIKIN